MRIESISIKDFLSHRDFQWTNIDPRLNIIVGPNGAGKTNFFHALRAVVTAFDHRQRPSWSRAGSDKLQGAFSIVVELEFNATWERELICSALRDMLCFEGAAPEGRYGVMGEKPLLRLATYLEDNLTQDDLYWLWRGRLVVQHRGKNSWTSWYESVGEHAFRVSLEGYQPGYPEYPHLYGSPVPEKHVEEQTRWVERLPQDQAQQLTAYVKGEDNDPGRLNFGRLLSKYPRGMGLKIEPRSHVPTYLAFERNLGIALRDDAQFTAFDLFGHLVRHAFVFTENVRGQSAEIFPLAELTTPPPRLENSSDLALYLFGKKNGGQNSRQVYRSIEATFHHLTGLRFDVALVEAPREPTPILPLRQPIEGELEGSHEAILEILIGDGEREYPLAFSGAGRAEALFLSVVVNGQPGQIVLLDEPAQNLHPTVQSTFLSLMRGQQDQQVFVITHSPMLVPAAALESVVRFLPGDGGTGKMNPVAWSARKRDALTQALVASSEARSLLFSRGVILVEGETEFGALPIWYEQQSKTRFEDANVAIYNVGGDTGFEKFIAFLREFRVPWVVICDGGVIGDPANTNGYRRHCGIGKQLDAAGIGAVPQDLDAQVFASRRATLDGLNVLTLADSAEAGHEGFEEVSYIAPLFLATKQKHVDIRSKSMLGALMALEYPCPKGVIELLDLALQRIGTHRQ